MGDFLLLGDIYVYNFIIQTCYNIFMQKTEEQIEILKNQIAQIEKDIQEAEEKMKTVIKEEDKNLLIHIISTGELELNRLREELEYIMNR